jgi:hypothetical protein
MTNAYWVNLSYTDYVLSSSATRAFCLIITNAPSLSKHLNFAFSNQHSSSFMIIYISTEFESLRKFTVGNKNCTSSVSRQSTYCMKQRYLTCVPLLPIQQLY